MFEYITAQSGLGAYEGMTHGVAWGDYDGDGRPGLYVTNHLKPAMLFLNIGNGRFAAPSWRVKLSRRAEPVSTSTVMGSSGRWLHLYELLDRATCSYCEGSGRSQSLTFGFTPR